MNNNNTAIEAALENTLSRDGTAPNAMEADLDMNEHRIINLADGVLTSDAVTVGQLNDALEFIEGGSADAQFLVSTANGVLPNERVVTDTSTVSWDHSTSGQSKANVIDNSITYAKMQNVSATSRVLGRITSGSGVVEELTGSDVKTLMSIASTDITDFTEATQDVVGALLGADGGDLDWTYVDGSGTLGASVKNDAITYAKMQDVSASSRIMGRSTSGAGDMEELTPATVSLMFSGMTGEYNIVAYGAVGDDSTINTTAIQAALDAIKTNGGGTLVIPEGIFRTGALTYDISAISSPLTHRLRIRGSQSSTSVIKCTGVGSACFTYDGNSGANQTGYLAIENVSFFGDLTASSVGLDINSGAFCHFQNVNIEAFETNWDISDVDQSQWDTCNGRWGVHGFVARAAVSTTGPNSLVFNNCNWSNNSSTGMTITNANCVNFLGGSFQYNGSTLGSSSHYGLKLINVGGPGYGTVNLLGTAFEGTKGLSDFYHTQDTYFSRVNFLGCSFYRTDSPTGRFSTNFINVSGSSTTSEYTISGCTMFTGGGYTPNAARPFFSITGTGFFNDDSSNYYESGVEAPSWSGKSTLRPSGAMAGPFGVGQTWKLQGFNTTSAAYVDFLTLTAANPPTLNLASTVTHGGGTIVTINGSNVIPLPSGVALNWNSSDVTLTHSSNLLSGAGGQLNWTYNGAAGTAPIVSVNTTDDSNVEALRIEGDRATPANNDAVRAGFYLSSAAGTQTEIGRITAFNPNVTAGAEAGQIRFGTNNAGSVLTRAYINASTFTPLNNDGLALGTATTSWADLFLASGGVINFNNGDVTITHSSDRLVVSGGEWRVTGSGQTFSSQGDDTNFSFYTGGGVRIGYVRGDSTNLSIGVDAGNFYLLPSGNVGVGTVSAAQKLTVEGNIAGFGYNSRNGTGGSYGANVFNINWTGSVAQFWVDNSNIGNITITSDARVKQGIEDLGDDATDLIARLRPVSFRWKGEKDDKTLQYGFTAQDVQEVFPDLVHNTNYPHEDCPDGMLRVDHIGLIAPMVKAMQEMTARISALEEYIKKMDGKINNDN